MVNKGHKFYFTTDWSKQRQQRDLLSVASITPVVRVFSRESILGVQKISGGLGVYARSWVAEPGRPLPARGSGYKPRKIFRNLTCKILQSGASNR